MKIHKETSIEFWNETRIINYHIKLKILDNVIFKESNASKIYLHWLITFLGNMPQYIFTKLSNKKLWYFDLNLININKYSIIVI
jgi:hypothetical protein